MILISMALYIAVGIEIVKRRRAFSSIATDSIPLDDKIILPDTSNSCSTQTGIRVTTTHGTSSSSDQDIESGDQTSASPTIDKSTLGTWTSCRSSASRGSTSTQPLTTTTKTTKTTKTVAVNNKQRSSLSFRQYILMPLFFFLALLSVWVAPSTNRLATFIHPTFASYPLLLVVGASGSLRGFWNGLVFLTLGMKSRKRSKRGSDRAAGTVEDEAQDPHLGTGGMSTRSGRGTTRGGGSVSDGS